MKLYLHVGTHKTGSTHLQSYLRLHAAQLEEQGLLYPDLADWFGGKSQIAHHQLVAAAAQGKNKLDSRRRALEQARLQADPGKTMLLSAEPAYRRTYPQNCSPQTLWEGRRRYLKRLQRMVAGFDSTVVICFRNRATFGDSHYGSAVKTGYAGTFEQYLVDHAFMYDYDRQKELFHDAFGDVLVYPFEEAAKGGVSETFLSQIGFQAPSPDTRPPTRRSPDPRMWLWNARHNLKSASDGVFRRSVRISFSTTSNAAEALPDADRSTLWSEADRPFLESFGDVDALAAVGGRKTASLSDADHARLDAAFSDWLAKGKPKRK